MYRGSTAAPHTLDADNAALLQVEVDTQGLTQQPVLQVHGDRMQAMCPVPWPGLQWGSGGGRLHMLLHCHTCMQHTQMQRAAAYMLVWLSNRIAAA